MRKKHFSELLAERQARQQRGQHQQEAEEREEVYRYEWERRKRMWERIEIQLREQK